MQSLEEIKNKLSSGNFEFTRHAFKRVIERNISEKEIREVGAELSLIEKYPDDKYFPSALFLGFTKAGRPLHIQLSLGEFVLLKIITIYEPNEMEWINFYERR